MARTNARIVRFGSPDPTECHKCNLRSWVWSFSKGKMGAKKIKSSSAACAASVSICHPLSRNTWWISGFRLAGDGRTENLRQRTYSAGDQNDRTAWVDGGAGSGTLRTDSFDGCYFIAGGAIAPATSKLLGANHNPRDHAVISGIGARGLLAAVNWNRNGSSGGSDSLCLPQPEHTDIRR